MGLIGTVVDFLRSSLGGDLFGEVKTDPGSGNLEQAQAFSTPGIDSAPLDGDKVISIDAEGVRAAVGYADVRAAGQAEKGETMLYSREQSGARVARVYAQADGSIIIESLNGGAVTINGVTISADGDIETGGTVTATEVVAGSVGLSNHVHPYTDTPVGPAITQGPEGPAPP